MLTKLPIYLLLTLASAYVDSGNAPEWESAHFKAVSSQLTQPLKAPKRSSATNQIRIALNYDGLTSLSATLQSVIKTVYMQGSLSWISQIISVHRLEEPLQVPIGICGIDFHVPAEHQTQGIADTDLVVYVTVVNDPGQKWLIRSGACYFDGSSGQPLAGVFQYNSAGQWDDDEVVVALHRQALFHILGFSSHLFANFRDENGQVYTQPIKTGTARGKPIQYLSFLNLIQRAQVAFACNLIEGVELENFGPSHWETRIMGNEFMTMRLYPGVAYTDLSLAVLEASHWYVVTYDIMDEVRFGRNKGCDFLTKKCVIDGVAQFTEFCASNMDNICSFDITYKGECQVLIYDSNLPTQYQYFSYMNRGGSDPFADYCPMPLPKSDGNCQGKGIKPTLTNPTLHGECVSPDSSCFVSTLINVQYSYWGDQTHSSCFPVTCKSGEAVVTVGEIEVICPSAGGNVGSIPGFNGYLTCPAYEVLCGSEQACFNDCSGLGNCLYGECQCYEGYLGSDCGLRCHYSCRGCAGQEATQCKSCWSNAQLVNGVCQCKDGFYGEPQACQPCHASCAKCSGGSSSTCTLCKAPTQLPDGTTSGTCSCPPEGWFLDGTGMCSLCDSACLQCKGAKTQCLKCKSNAILSGTTCSCKDGFYGLPENCQPCDPMCATCTGSGPKACSKCALVGSSPPNCSPCDKTCATCFGATATQCLSCSSKAALALGACKCLSGYYLSTSGCQPCHKSCFTCTEGAKEKCTRCQSSEAFLSANPGFCKCPVGSYMYEELGTCKKCPLLDGICDLSCGNSCPQAPLLVNTQRMNNLLVCKSGYAPSRDKLTCELCYSTCVKCTGPSNVDCSECELNAELKNGGCVCKLGYYFDGKNCLACSFPCASCFGDGDSRCITCIDYAQLTVNKCGCQAGYFPSVDKKTCAKCHDTCLTCSLAGEYGCVTCFARAVRKPNGNCMCQDGYYPNLTSAQCEFCHPTCKMCDGPTASDCTNVCVDNVAPINSECPCKDHTTRSYDKLTCVPCHNTCEVCSGPDNDQCTDCKDFAKLPAGATVGSCTCKDGYFLNTATGNCDKCYINCATCKSAGVSDCLSCPQGKSLQKAAPAACI